MTIKKGHGRINYREENKMYYKTPWNVKNVVNNRGKIVPSSYEVLANDETDETYQSEICRVEDKNTANIIAAAPDMLEVLEERPRHCEYEHEIDGDFDFETYISDVEEWAIKVRKVIAKARSMN